MPHAARSIPGAYHRQLGGTTKVIVRPTPRPPAHALRHEHGVHSVALARGLARRHR